MQSSALLSVLSITLLAAAACGNSDSDSGSGGSAGSGSGGSAGSGTGATGGGAGSGTGGGSGGTTFQGRRCGEGAPCSPGATCKLATVETAVTCNCDPSGHFLCDAQAYGGAPPFDSCSPESACKEESADTGPKTCLQNNGYCTRTCTCQGSCNTECTGSGPAQGYVGEVCDLGYCAGFSTGICEVHDGTCDYSVSCQGTPKITGLCP